ncbi:MAG TPA: Shedu immune nuclease family protein [Alphaproteobacteria bacterium]|jgi:hypothetical protein|nr:Shedu immune nuclease family protein [Alphaproteobacteria bacterium]
MENNFDIKLSEEIEAISIDAKSRGFGVSKQILYKTEFTTLVIHAFHIPKEDGEIHHFDLKINKYKRKKKSESWNLVMDEMEEYDHGDFQSLKIDCGDGEAVKKLTAFLNAQYEAIGQKIEKRKVIIDNPEDFDFSFIKSLNPNKLKDIDSLVSTARLESIINRWNNNKNNNNEEFWQKLFQNYTWILSQIFSCPFILIGEKFYCGGKEDDDKGGVKGDLLYKNDLTGNLAFVEIKTPETKIVGKQYRGDDDGRENVVYSMSDGLTGGVNQVLNQRKIYLNTHGDNNGKFLHNAKCILVIGNVDKFKNEDEKKSFELFRSATKEVEIIAFDELFGRTSAFLELLKEEK